MSLGRLRLITFDVTNTLLQFRTTPSQQYGEIGALFGVLCDNNKLAKSFKANWYRMNRTYPNFGSNCRMDWQVWWRQLIASSFSDSGSKIPEEKLDNLTNHLLDLYQTSSCWQHCNGSIDLLNCLRMQQQLGSRDGQKPPFVLGIISNFDPRLQGLLKNLKIDHFFEFALNSYDSKVEKPHSEIFDLAMRSALLSNLKPSECLHIGDGPITDFLSAKAVGWNAALVHEKSFGYLVDKYGSKIEEFPQFVFPSLYDFHRKLSNNVIVW